ncbi:MAG: competence/damage-inducible protein A [Alphaproteobacteria bacterium]|nr:competence/damage-inducible protein A [Alphaproteobacteria bacterium]
MVGPDSEKTACVLIIGNEILSGRVQDRNLAYIAERLNDYGVRLREARVIPDREDAIIDTINECRQAFDYVLTTGGIGPTHDDITAECVAKAFGVALEINEEAAEAMGARSGDAKRNAARLRMARIPAGGTLIKNAISAAPGFQMKNVFVMAGVPSVAHAMVDALGSRLTGGTPVRSRGIVAHVSEGAVAASLTAIQERFPDTDIGSYPFYRSGRFGTTLVVRSTDSERIDAAVEEIKSMIREMGAEPEEEMEAV